MDLGISLRPKRSGTTKFKISNPTLISAPRAATSNTVDLSSIATRSTNASATTLAQTTSEAQARPRDDRSATADLVIRRYSTRFTNFDLNASTDNVPNVPSIPNKYAGQPPPSRDGAASIRSLKLDSNIMKDPNFDAEDYVSRALSNASEEDIEKFQRDLRKMKVRADTDIQHTVFANRAQFIKISKEAEKLKDELRVLRSLMSDLTSTLGQINVSEDSSGDVGSSLSAMRGYRRTSVANLEALWNAHLQELWRRVEGSQKYLPAIPGRHVVYESGRWVELNSATWKPRRKVHLILLNDHLLIAMDKKRNQDAPKDPGEKQTATQLVALKCWPLQDVQIADLNMKVKPGTAEADASGNSINIRVGTESMTFATASKEVREKLALLSNFRKASEDLRRTLEVETNEQAVSHRESMNGLSSPFLKSSFLGDSVSAGLGSKADILIDVDGKPQSLRRVEADIDDLDIKIALQSFEEAVERVETLQRIVKGIRTNTTAHTLLSTKLDDRVSKLANQLIDYLGQTNSWLGSTQKNVNWLLRLGYENPAREAYLEARSQVIQKRVRQVIFEGDLHLYIYQISFIYFTVIKHTASIFQSCFPQPMLSTCVKWAKGHVDDFNALLERQLSSIDANSETYKACMDRAKEHASMLHEVGLDFKDFIGTSVLSNQR